MIYKVDYGHVIQKKKGTDRVELKGIQIHIDISKLYCRLFKYCTVEELDRVHVLVFHMSGCAVKF